MNKDLSKTLMVAAGLIALALAATSARSMGLIDGVARLARRHRIAAAAAATVFLALVGATLAVTTFAIRAEREKTLAVASREMDDD